MRFSIRDLFLVTVIVALVLAWVLDRSSLATQVKRWEHRATIGQDSLSQVGFRLDWEGDSISISKIEKEPASVVVPNSSAPATNSPKP
jgi:hypothetical protein